MTDPLRCPLIYLLGLISNLSPSVCVCARTEEEQGDSIFSLQLFYQTEKSAMTLSP